MKHVLKKELELFRKIKKEKEIICSIDAVSQLFGTTPTSSFKNKMNIVKLANKVNEFENIGEVETYESLYENKRFIRWYNTLNEYKKTKESENLK